MSLEIPGHRLLRQLNAGAKADLYLAEEEPSGRQVAVKILRPELTSELPKVLRFIDEAKVCQGLEHPNIIRQFGVHRLSTGQVYILSEYLDGMSLRDHLRSAPPLSAEEAIALALPLCDALEHLHSRRVVHRDLRPANIFLVGGLQAFQPKLLDFGVALFEVDKSARTAAGVLLSHVEYIAPECIRGERASPSADLYALGATLYEAVLGHPPFSDADPAKVLAHHLNDPVPALPPEYAALDGVIQRCMAKRPQDRFVSALEVRRALAGDAPLGLDVTLAPSSAPPEPKQESPSEIYPGQVLGHYTLEHLLGEGAMGEVYQARHQKLRRQVAIKVLRPALAADHELVQRFFQEADAITQINHEHIVQVHDFVEDRQPGGVPRVYCVMELLKGRSLAQLIRGEPLPLERIIHLARQACEALEAAHRFMIVHRDIKPDNIFVCEDERRKDFVKLLDFGVAKLMSPGNSAARTMHGVIIGTPSYMSPEQASGGELDFRTDIYSLGVCLYEMITGWIPFESPSFPALMVRIASEAPRPLGTTARSGESIPAALEQLVSGCLSKDPAARPQSMAELSALLASSLESGAQPSAPRPIPLREPIPSSPSAPLRPARGAPRWRVAVIGVTALLVLSGVALVAARQGHAPPATPRTTPVQTAAAPPSAPVTISPSKPKPDVPQRVTLALNTQPSGATVIRLDRHLILGKTPLVQSLPRSGAPLLLELDLTGYKPLQREVTLDRDVTAEWDLRPSPRSGARPPKAKRHRARLNQDDLIDPLRP